jgi:hypothetical protein
VQQVEIAQVHAVLIQPLPEVCHVPHVQSTAIFGIALGTQVVTEAAHIRL